MAGGSSAPREDDNLAVEVRRSAFEDLEEKLVWRKNAPLLYDLFALCDLEQTAQSVSWLPDVEDEPTKLAVGLRQKGCQKSKLLVLELTCLVDNESSEEPWKTWSIEDLGAVSGFGLKGMKDQAPLRTAVEFKMPSDANRIAACPTQASLLAVKGCCGNVFLYDCKSPEGSGGSEGSAGCKATLSEEKPVEGYALEWSPSDVHFLSTGGHDGLLSIWDVQAKSKLWSTKAHEGPLNDLCHSANGQQLVTLGEDHATVIWDIRSKSKASGFQVATEQLSVDWNLSESHLLLTGGKDGVLQIWDMRKVHTPFKSLKGHRGEVVQVKWCPSEVTDSGVPNHFLASACAGGQTILWNMSADEPNEDGEAPEVLFIHSGHHGAVNDFGLAPLDDFLFCSVAEDNLQLWQPAAVIMEEDECCESAAKRQRND